MELAKVVKDEDRLFMQEAIDLCEKGFFRASYIIAFIVGIESLKSKLKELTKISSSVAESYKEIDSLEKNHRASDETVIKVAKDHMFLTDGEFSKLDYFRTQRNIYSHPYGLQPTAIDCQHIIQSMTDIVLTKNIKFGTEMINFIVKCITEESIFLTDDKDVVERYIHDLVNRINENYFFVFFDKLSEYYESLTVENENTLIGRRVKFAIIALLNNITIDRIFSDETKITSYIIERKKSASLCFSNNKAFKLLSEQNRDMIFNLLLEQKNYEDLSCIYYDNGNRNSLTDSQLTRLQDILNSTTSCQILCHFPAELTIKCIITMLKSHDWSKQNDAISLYKEPGFLSSLSRCNKDDIVTLGRNILQSSGENDRSYYSCEARSLLQNIKSDENVCFEIKKGIILECITNERNKIRPKLRHIATVSQIFSTLSDKKKRSIKTELKKYVDDYEILSGEDWTPLNVEEFSDIYEKIQLKLSTQNDD